MAIMIKSNTFPLISRTISDARIKHIIKSETKADATAMGLWDKIQDWFCGTRKGEALAHLYDLIHHGNLSEPQIALQKLKAFHYLSSMAGEAYRDNFKAVITENSKGGWDFEFIIVDILNIHCAVGKELEDDNALSFSEKIKLQTPSANIGEQENDNEPLITEKDGHQTQSTFDGRQKYDIDLFYAQIQTFLNKQNIAIPGAALYKPAMARLAALERFDVILSNQHIFFLEIAHLISQNTPDTHILILKNAFSGQPFFSFADENLVKQSPRMRKNAADAASYLHGLPEIKAYLSEDAKATVTDNFFTARTLKHIKNINFENLKTIYREAPPSPFNHNETYKTPSEVTFLWMSLLHNVASTLTNIPKKLVYNLLKKQQSRYLQHKELTLASTRNALKDDVVVLRRAGFDALANMADSKGRGAIPCLLNQLPESDEDLPPTRLHDNLYGRVFESKWMALLVANPPDEVKSAMTTIARYYSSYLGHSPNKKQQIVLKKLHKQIVDDKRLWFQSYPEIKKLSNPTFEWPVYLEEVQKILCSEIKTGEQCIAVPYLAVKLFNATNSLPLKQHEVWQIKTNANYVRNIKPRTGRTVEDRALAEANVTPIPTAGITLRYQPSAVSDADRMTSEIRPCNRYHIPSADVIDNYPTVKNALQHGLPYSGGVSGSTAIILSIIKKLKKEGTEIDLRMSLLGTIMFVNYDGGHSIHESLWVANQKGINVGNANSSNKDLDGFISDYEAFQALYDGTKCGKAIDDALSIAWEETFDYITQHSADYGALRVSQNVKRDR